MKNERSRSRVEGEEQRWMAACLACPEISTETSTDTSAGTRTETSAWAGAQTSAEAGEERAFLSGPEELPAVPARIATRIALELMLAEPVLDLRYLSSVILEDLGATIEVLRLGAREAMPSERAERIEDALAVASFPSVIEAVARAPFGHDGRLSACWMHGQQIAIAMHEAAAAFPVIRSGEARLVGLLHELGNLPAMLGWTLPPFCRGGAQGARLAEHWRLPHFLVSALHEIETRQRASIWGTMLEAAHRRTHSVDGRSRVPAAPVFRSRVLHFERPAWKPERTARPGVPA